MNYGAIKFCDIANGIGIRTVLFVSGCTHHCKGCFQPETWDFAYGQPYTKETEQTILDSLAPSYIHGLTLLGGEPMEPDNQRALLPLLRRLKAEYPNKTVWCYSGYTYEELTGISRARCEVTDEMLTLVDVLVDGEFVLQKKNISLRFRGSENQRLIDLPRTREQGSVVLWEG
ncbi:MAG: anaerobic ribonucleoside-triphosphate reductase activating protein [Ruminococcaceae bacterium]|nr:anaerobic ribonucleoside-triphosphate reductase activating protein [Oscillospiraceae bacterium]